MQRSTVTSRANNDNRSIAIHKAELSGGDKVMWQKPGKPDERLTLEDLS
jgi:hypothetical protein